MVEVKTAEKLLQEIEKLVGGNPDRTIPMAILTMNVNLGMMRDALVKSSGKIEGLTEKMVELTEAVKKLAVEP